MLFFVAEYFGVRSTKKGRTLIPKVTYRVGTHEVQFEFPINHINVKEVGGLVFQIETGPILFIVPNSNCDLESLTLFYVIFNCFDQLTYAVAKSRMKRRNNIGFYSEVNILDAEVKVFEIL